MPAVSPRWLDIVQHRLRGFRVPYLLVLQQHAIPATTRLVAPVSLPFSGMSMCRRQGLCPDCGLSPAFMVGLALTTPNRLRTRDAFTCEAPMDTTLDQPVSVRAFRAHLADYLRQAQAGSSFVILSRGEPLARIAPPDPVLPRAALFGAHKGDIWMADDFDADDADLIAAAEAALEP
jgi:prevent-host-death family protein